MDRVAKFCQSFRTLVKEAGIEPVLLPPQSPNCHAHRERFHRSLQEECLDRMIVFGERSWRQATRAYLEHSHRERNHQGRNNRLLEPDADVGKTTGTVPCRERLGGLWRYDHRAAA
jgi:hypothetical protein